MKDLFTRELVNIMISAVKQKGSPIADGQYGQHHYQAKHEYQMPCVDPGQSVVPTQIRYETDEDSG